MIDWKTVKTVLLDMDGTLLDLHFDNHFWLEHMPRRYAELREVSLEEARAELMRRYKQVEGTMALELPSASPPSSYLYPGAHSAVYSLSQGVS